MFFQFLLCLMHYSRIIILHTYIVVPMPRHFSCHSFIGTAAHDSQFSGTDSTVQSKSLVHPTANESFSLHCRDTFAFCLHQKKFLLMFLYLQPLHSSHSFLTSCIQKLPVPHTRVTPSFRYITLSRVESLIPSLHLPLPAPLKFSNKVPVPPVTSFQTFLRTCSEHFFHSVTFGTAHKSKCFISLRSPCLRTDLATLHSASTLVFADT